MCYRHDHLVQPDPLPGSGDLQTEEGLVLRNAEVYLDADRVYRSFGQRQESGGGTAYLDLESYRLSTLAARAAIHVILLLDGLLQGGRRVEAFPY